MLYDIKLKINYAYQNPVGDSRHMTRLLPANLPGEQKLIAGSLTIDPIPAERIDGVDFFGNSFAEIAFLKSHDALEFLVLARVERLLSTPIERSSVTLDALTSELAGQRSLAQRSPLHFTGPSARAPVTTETTTYAKQRLYAQMPVIEIIGHIGASIFQDFDFDPKATSVETPMLDAFHGRRGVCQDFAHIMISCLRGLGVPAAYVSGFLRTEPPEGAARMEGVDAMHAWVSVWCGSLVGWVEFDPTNNVFVGCQHIVIARGRDYFDVAPIKGIMRISGDHRSKQAVDVIPVSQASDGHPV